MNDPSYPDIIVEQIIRSHRRSIALEITREGQLVVRAPIRAPIELIQKLVHQKRNWIRAKQDLVKSKQNQASIKEFVDGELFLYLGQNYPLKIVDQADQSLTFQNQFLLSRNHLHQAKDIFIAWYRTSAMQLFTERAAWYASLFGLSYTSIKINNAKTRWGSCSAKGTLNFNYRLILAPLPVIDYMIVHELAHLVERNHSTAYWNQVVRMLPDYTEPRRWLRKNGYLLTI
jgi:predicted metal-dependent hydrolase